MNIQVLFLSSILIIILFVLLKAVVEIVVAKKEILVMTFLFALWEAMFAYNRFEIRDKFLIAMLLLQTNKHPVILSSQYLTKHVSINWKTRLNIIEKLSKD